jgi:hypothetical protein
MSPFIVRIVSKELITPDRHMSVWGQIFARLAIDDPADFRVREMAIPASRDAGQIRRRHFEIRIDDSVAARVVPMTGRAMLGE